MLLLKKCIHLFLKMWLIKANYINQVVSFINNVHNFNLSSSKLKIAKTAAVSYQTIHSNTKKPNYLKWKSQ